jgi:aminoglycoside phosphotransferase (APT) family kinase protein
MCPWCQVCVIFRRAAVIDEIRAWLAREGYPAATDLAAMSRGLGSTELWSFQPDPGESRLVLRMFKAGAYGSAEREALAMEAAARHGLPVPLVLARGVVEHRPVLLSTFAEGVPAFATIVASPATAPEIGRAMGDVLGRLHQVPAPEGLSSPGAWIDRGGPALEPLRSRLENVPNQDRLLHLDYHPLNVLVKDGAITGVIDWENTAMGPPHMDLARTRAILRAIVAGSVSAPVPSGVVLAFEQGLVEGHDATYGVDPHPALSLAWGLAMTVDDLERQARRPGSPISPEAVARLAAERDDAIEMAMSTG